MYVFIYIYIQFLHSVIDELCSTKTAVISFLVFLILESPVMATVSSINLLSLISM